MSGSEHTPQETLGLSTCEREPIHVPGSIQPHGFLIALDAETSSVCYASENAGDFIGGSAAAVLGRPVEELFAPAVLAAIRQVACDPLFSQRALFVAYVRSRGDKPSMSYPLLAHRYGRYIILEGEKTAADAPSLRPGVHHEMDRVLASTEGATDLRSLLQIAAKETRRITGFDRVMVYQFDPEWNGIVVAEEGNSVLASYLDLRFPASDIPRQARELYRVNRLRLIASASYTPVRLLAAAAETASLDLSLSALRSVSPVHLEYMRNMGTGSSMSVSLMRGGELWGLISCHSRDSKVVPFDVRATCELFGQVLSLQIAAREQTVTLNYRMQLNVMLGRLISGMSRHQDLISGLRAQSIDMLSLADAKGAAVMFHGQIELMGRTPTKAQITALADWLNQHAPGEVSAFDRLSEKYPPAADYSDAASGLLAVSLSRVHKNFLLWFRPEVIATVKWGGNPAKPVDEPTRLHPRKSFEAWVEIVRGRSTAWQSAELDVARELRRGIVEIALQHAEQLAAISHELNSVNKELESMSYTISHDLREPLRAMYGYADSLREDAADKLSVDELDRLVRISRAAHRLDRMIRDVLRYGHVSRIEIAYQPVNLDEVVRKVLALQPALQAGGAQIRIKGALETVIGQTELLQHAVFALLSNAVKFVAPSVTPVVIIKAERRDSRVRLWIEDNGIGMAPGQDARIFEVFQRLHAEPMFEGNGVGLAIAKRAITRLNGDIGVDSVLGRGSRFWIELPLA